MRCELDQEFDMFHPTSISRSVRFLPTSFIMCWARSEAISRLQPGRAQISGPVSSRTCIVGDRN